jgi:hypothetical protein
MRTATGDFSISPQLAILTPDYAIPTNFAYCQLLNDNCKVNKAESNCLLFANVIHIVPFAIFVIILLIFFNNKNNNLDEYPKDSLHFCVKVT